MKWRSCVSHGMVVVSIIFVAGTSLVLATSTLSTDATAAPRDPKARPSKKSKSAKAAKGKSASSKKTDYLAPGLAAFQKGDFAEAVSKFEVATKKDSKNPLSWLHHARALVALKGAQEPTDYCDAEKNWILSALSSLSSAWVLDRVKTGAVIAGFGDASFKKFQDRPEYKKWSQLRRLPLKTDLATQAFFVENNDWLIPNGSLPSNVATLAPSYEFVIASSDGSREVGRWTAGADRVVIKTGKSLRTMNLTTASQPIGASKRSFQQIVLKDVASGETWLMGPEIADCPK